VVAVRLYPLAYWVYDAIDGGLCGGDQLSHLDLLLESGQFVFSSIGGASLLTPLPVRRGEEHDRLIEPAYGGPTR
jgi:hypothetical protein